MEIVTQPAGLRVLFLTSQLPYPPHQGATIRSYNLIRVLSKRAQIDLLSFIAYEDELLRCHPLKELCRRVEGIRMPPRSLWQRALTTAFSPQPDMALRFTSRLFSERLANWLYEETYRAAIFVGIDTGRYLLQAAKWKRRLPIGALAPRLIFDDLNAEYLLQQRAFATDLRQFYHPRRLAGALYSFVQWHKLRRFEAAVCRHADHVVAVSEADRLALQRIAPGRPIDVVPNGVDLERYHPLPPAEQRVVPTPALVFTGKMDFRPNVDAACWFANEVMPGVHVSFPDAVFAIVGRDPHPLVRQLAHRRGILVTGEVEDDLPYFRDADVYVVPIRVGGGTRLKVLTALAMGKAIVSTSLGCEGIGVESGRELLIADSAEEFCASITRLLSDPGLCRRLGDSGRRFVEERYGWETIAPRLEHLYTCPE